MKLKKTAIYSLKSFIILELLIISALIVKGDFSFDNRIPNVEHARNRESKLWYPMNENGYTYGSQKYNIEIEPDLIKAIGVDGITGYVYADDLEGPLPGTPKEALALMEQMEDYRSIPLYDSDGQTVLGTFIIN